MMEQLKLDFAKDLEIDKQNETVVANLQNSVNLLLIQNQIVNLSLRLNVIEKILIDKGVFTQDEYTSEIKTMTEQTVLAIKKIQEQENEKVLEQLNKEKELFDNVQQLKNKLSNLSVTKE